MQKHIRKATSIVRTTEVSSISSGCDSQSAILVFDWLLADSVMNTVKAIVKRLRTATPAGRWKVSFSIKLRLTKKYDQYDCFHRYSPAFLRRRLITATIIMSAAATDRATVRPFIRLVVDSVLFSSSRFMT